MKVYNNNDGSTGKLSTSKGNQVKMRIGDVWYKADYLGYEGASEYLCSHLLSQTNIFDYVKYELESITINDVEFNGCSSRHFLGEEEELITVNRLFLKYYGTSISDQLGKNSLEKKIEIFVELMEKATGLKGFGKTLTMILEWDRFVLNEDRHFNNLAVIRNVSTGEFRICPIFDNGAAFLSDTREDYPLEKSVYGLVASVKSKPFYPDFDRQTETCEALFGKQLVISRTIHISDEVISNIMNQYGEKVSGRITEIFEIQKSICENLEVKPSKVR